MGMILALLYYREQIIFSKTSFGELNPKRMNISRQCFTELSNWLLYLLGRSRRSAAKNYLDFVEKVDVANLKNPATDKIRPLYCMSGLEMSSKQLSPSLYHK